VTTLATSYTVLRVTRWVPLVVLFMVLPLRADAQQERPIPPEAQELFDSAREHYRNGRYPEAAEELELALSLDPASQTLVFNLSRVYELMGDFDRAIEMTERYLARLPPEAQDERDRQQERLQRLRGGQQEAGSWARGRPELRAPRTLVETRGVFDSYVVVAIVAAGALVVVGAIVGVIALGKHDEAEGYVLDPRISGAAQEAERDQLRADATRLGRVADVSLGLGVAAGLAGVLLFALRPRTDEAEPEEGASVDLLRGGALLSWRGVF